MSPLQEKNAPTSKLINASGSVREVSPHLENARKPTWVKLAGSFREVSLRQFENILDPTVVKESGSITDVSKLQ